MLLKSVFLLTGVLLLLIKAVLSTLAGFFYYSTDVLVSLTLVKQFKILEKEEENKLKKDLTLFGILNTTTALAVLV
jgi:hypothetical protein